MITFFNSYIYFLQHKPPVISDSFGSRNHPDYNVRKTVLRLKHEKINLNLADVSRLSSVMILQPDQVVPSTNLLFKLDVSLPLVNRGASSEYGRCY